MPSRCPPVSGAGRPARARAALLLVAAVPAATAAPAASPADGLEAVVVTATRSPVAVLDYAGSATRLDADVLARLGATHSSEVLNRVPGGFLQRGSGQEVLVALRSPVLTGAGACGAFLVLEDDVPIRPVGFCNVNELFELNLEQAGAVEVLRGPGVGVLGAKAIHGAVHALSARPPELARLALGAVAGADGWRQFRLATRTRTGDPQAPVATLVAHATHDGGWRDAAGFGEAKANAALQGRAARGDWRLSLAATRLDQETAGFVAGLDAYRDAVLRRSNANPEAFREAWSTRAIAAWRGDFGFDARVYARASAMEFLQHFLLGQPREENAQRSAGALLAWSGSTPALDWRAGIDLEVARGTLQQWQARPTTGGTPVANAIRPAGLHYDYDVDARLAAAWVQADRRWGGGWSATAALRAEQVAYDYDNRMRDGNDAADGTPCPGGCLYSRPADSADRYAALAPRIGVAWRYAPGQSWYASLARGFRPPEATELYRLQRQQRVADLGSERIDAVETGLRGRGGVLAWSLASYAMDKQGVILRDSAGFNVDEGRTRHVGVEYELAWTPQPALTLAANGTRARHTYRFDRAVEGGDTIRSGADVDTAPRRLDSVRLEWRPAVGVQAELERLGVGPYFADAANRHRYPGHVLLNLRAAFALPGSLVLRTRITNLADRDYADRADFAFGNWRYFPGRGRAWFVELEWRGGTDDAAPGAPGSSR